jgi:hypothetical protein
MSTRRRTRLASLLCAGVVVVSCGESDGGNATTTTPTGGASSGAPSGGAAGASPSQGGAVGGDAAGNSSGGGAEPGGTGGAASGGRAAVAGGRPSITGGSGTAASGAPEAAGTAGDAADPGPGNDAEERYQACSAYVVEVCSRREACGESQSRATCISINLPRCPDLYFSSGARVTVAALAACTEAWTDAACEDLRAGSSPDCGFDAGSVPLDGACRFNTQCQSLACGRHDDQDCGACVPILNPGDACADGQGACPRGTTCSGTCAPARRFGLPAGSACEAAGQCQDGYICRSSATGMLCQTLLEEGDTCDGSWECRPGLYCDVELKVCAESAPIGSPCVNDGWGQRRCAEGICDATIDPPTCTELVPAGSPCWLREGLVDPRGNCESGLTCACLDGDCETRECRREVLVGEACDAIDALCVTGTVCEDGVCRGQTNQGLFESACTL